MHFWNGRATLLASPTRGVRVLIGTIVKSSSHISYLCRVFGTLETDSVPEPGDYAFGTFVTLSPADNEGITLVGVVRDTLLLNPDYGNAGPRLSPPRDNAVFAPDYLSETGVLVDVLILGWIVHGKARHTVPPLAAQIGTAVAVMPEPAVIAFHRDASGRFQMGYYPQLLLGGDPLTAQLLLAVLDRLEPAFPSSANVIGVLRNNLAWKARVVPAG
ncbi:MAG TPA: hypothetical protein VFB58_05295 [Chloroflexota bacterium]|nr:hypothetical protein [Chloroflexota bacterium]